MEQSSFEKKQMFSPLVSFFPGVKRLGRGVDFPLPSSAEVK
jgi:hypothetical protein